MKGAAETPAPFQRKVEFELRNVTCAYSQPVLSALAITLMDITYVYYHTTRITPTSTPSFKKGAMYVGLGLAPFFRALFCHAICVCESEPAYPTARMAQ